MFDEIVEIADTAVMGTITKRNPSGTETRTGDMIERSRLQVDARKWALSKLMPKKYGDAQRLEHTGADGGPVQVALVERLLAARKRVDEHEDSH